MFEKYILHYLKYRPALKVHHFLAPSDSASSYVIRMSDTIRDLKESRFDLAPDVTLLDVADLLTASDVYQTAGTKVSVRVPLAEQLQLGHVYFLALRALDDQDNARWVGDGATEC